MVRMRKDDYDAVLNAAEEVKAARGGPKHDAAIAKAKVAVNKSNANQKADAKAEQRAKHVERDRVARRGKHG